MEQQQLPALSLPAMRACMAAWNMPIFRAKQVLDWRNKGVLNPEHMRNIPQALKEHLSASLLCEPLRLVDKQCSSDGTRKYLFALQRSGFEHKMIEAVFIPEARRGTVCISSQMGCVLDCPFCYTGTQKFDGNLTAGEILAQILFIKQDLLQFPLDEALHNQVTHIVYMGMGEPLANEQAVHESLTMLMDPDALGLSRRRITVSTSGLIPQIQRLGEVAPVNLAVSLHAATDDLRDVLVPINKKYPLSQLRACLDAYPLAQQRHITLEYVMLAGVNDRDEDLQHLLQFTSPHRERINLIQFNPYPGSPYQGSSEQHIKAFANYLNNQGIRATVRRSRGQDIMAACGQLKAASET